MAGMETIWESVTGIQKFEERNCQKHLLPYACYILRYSNASIIICDALY